MRGVFAKLLTASAVLAATAAAPAGAAPAPRVAYMLYCSGCHGMDGTGSAPGGIPTFEGVIGSFTKYGDGRLYMVNVPGVVGANVGPAQIADILNYVVDTYAGPSRQAAAKPFDAAEIAELWARRPGDVISLRRDLVKRIEADGLPVPPDYPWP